MNRRFLAAVGAVFVVAMLLLGYYWWRLGGDAPATLSAMPTPMSGKTTPAVPEPIVPVTKVLRLAVGGFGRPAIPQSAALVPLLKAELAKVPGVELSPGEGLDADYRQKHPELADCIRAGEVMALGGRSSVWEWMLLGSLTTVKEENLLVARVVEVAKGRVLGFRVVAADKPAAELAADLAGLVRECRAAAAGEPAREYITLIGMVAQDGNRRPERFSTRLRRELTTHYQNLPVTLLEPAHLGAALRELRLDSPGTARLRGTNYFPNFSPRLWLLGGSCQGSEVAGAGLELNLQMRRIFGGATNMFLRETNGPALFTNIFQVIDSVRRGGLAAKEHTWAMEVQEFLEEGQKLAENTNPYSLGFYGGYPLDDEAVARHRRNLFAAVQTFESALLLEPANHTARMYLAACQREYPPGRRAEPLDIYRSVFEDPVVDRWTETAKQLLAQSFAHRTPTERADWYRAAAEATTNAVAREYYQTQWRQNARDAALEAGVSTGAGGGSELAQLAVDRLLETVRDFETNRAHQSELGLDKFTAAWGTNEAAANAALLALVPRLRAAATNGFPYLLASLMNLPAGTNAALAAEFDQNLADWSAHRREFRHLLNNFDGHLRVVARVAGDRKNYALQARLYAVILQRAQEEKQPAVILREWRYKLGYAYVSLENWSAALTHFQSCSNLPLRMGSPGPWGPALCVVRPSYTVAFFKKKLDLPVETDPRQFELEPTGITFCPSVRSSSLAADLVKEFGAFTTDADSLWLAMEGNLARVSFDLKTNALYPLPVDSMTPITRIIAAETNLWIARAGDGLVEFDKVAHTTRLFGPKQGPLMGFIGNLDLAADHLWLGYGLIKDGGLGRLDLRSHEFTNYAASPPSGADKVGPPLVPVTGLAQAAGGDLWFIVAYPRHPGPPATIHYSPTRDTWSVEAEMAQASCVFGAGDDLWFGGDFEPLADGAGPGVKVLRPATGKIRTLPPVPFLEESGITTIGGDARHLWIGGLGFVAQLNPETGEVLKYAYVKAATVDRIELAGGFLWVQFGCQLYRAAMP